jgi:hypothetical protein
MEVIIITTCLSIKHHAWCNSRCIEFAKHLLFYFLIFNNFSIRMAPSFSLTFSKHSTSLILLCSKSFFIFKVVALSLTHSRFAKRILKKIFKKITIFSTRVSSFVSELADYKICNNIECVKVVNATKIRP